MSRDDDKVKIRLYDHLLPRSRAVDSTELLTDFVESQAVRIAQNDEVQVFTVVQGPRMLSTNAKSDDASSEFPHFAVNATHVSSRSRSRSFQPNGPAER
jgi:hypothetical protein